MVQAVIAYLIVALAAGWVIWSVFVPGRVKKRVRASLRRIR